MQNNLRSEIVSIIVRLVRSNEINDIFEVTRPDKPVQYRTYPRSMGITANDVIEEVKDQQINKLNRRLKKLKDYLKSTTSWVKYDKIESEIDEIESELKELNK